MRILYDPAPRQTDEIFDPGARAAFFAHEVIEVDPAARDYTRDLPGVEILVSQQAMDRTRLDLAPDLRAIFNVETNFLPNIDYEACFERGIHVLTPAAVFALPVAEMGLGLGLSLMRDIHSGHMAFAQGAERYGLEGNHRAELLTGSDIGFIGFGDLGRALFGLLAPFRARVRVFDPWLPEGHLRRMGVQPAGLDEVLTQSRLIFVVASITTENAHLLDRARLAQMGDGAGLVLLSRAAIADFEALRAEAGRLRIATDVFPEEPMAPGDPLRQADMLLSAHKAGALTSALHEIGARVLEDISLIEQGLPPVACRRAERETVLRMRSKPVEVT